MAGDEVHQAEVEHLQPGQGGDLVGIAQRAVGFDQHVDRDVALDAALFAAAWMYSIMLGGLLRLGSLRNRDVGELLAGAATRMSTSCFHQWVRGSWMRTPAIVTVGCDSAPDDHLGVFLLAARRGAVLAVAGDVEDRPILSCSSSALRISFSLPAKCSQAGMAGKGFSPANRASLGWAGVRTWRSSWCIRILASASSRHQHRVVQIQHHVGVIFAIVLRFGQFRPASGSSGPPCAAASAEIVRAPAAHLSSTSVGVQRVAGEGRVAVVPALMAAIGSGVLQAFVSAHGTPR